eukprot:2237297-Rhodomonas_salina.4
MAMRCAVPMWAYVVHGTDVDICDARPWHGQMQAAELLAEELKHSATRSTPLSAYAHSTGCPVLTEVHVSTCLCVQYAMPVPTHAVCNARYWSVPAYARMPCSVLTQADDWYQSGEQEQGAASRGRKL